MTCATVLYVWRIVFVSVANQFVQPQSAADDGYHAFGELAGFVYCLKQKVKMSSAWPLVDLVEQWKSWWLQTTPNTLPWKKRGFLLQTVCRWSNFQVRQKDLLTFDSLDWRQVSWFYSSLSPWIGVSQTSFAKLRDFSQILSGWTVQTFKSL